MKKQGKLRMIQRNVDAKLAERGLKRSSIEAENRYRQTDPMAAADLSETARSLTAEGAKKKTGRRGIGFYAAVEAFDLRVEELSEKDEKKGRSTAPCSQRRDCC